MIDSQTHWTSVWYRPQQQHVCHHLTWWNIIQIWNATEGSSV